MFNIVSVHKPLFAREGRAADVGEGSFKICNDEIGGKQHLPEICKGTVIAVILKNASSSLGFNFVLEVLSESGVANKQNMSCTITQRVCQVYRFGSGMIGVRGSDLR